MYIQEKSGNNKIVKRILNTYPPLFQARRNCAAGLDFSFYTGEYETYNCRAGQWMKGPPAGRGYSCND